MGMPQMVMETVKDPGILQGIAAIFSAWVGMAAHLWKKNVGGETWHDVKLYVGLHFKTVAIASVLAFGAGVGVVAVQTADASVWAILSGGFTAGWTMDSAMEISRKTKEMRP